MPDFDVAAAGLSVPPPLASLTTYRPAISVKNNGIHAALAVGTVRIYKSGALVFVSDVFSATIPAGETRLAQAVDYWTPDTVGTYNVQGYVSCNLDQVEPNNNLAPVSVTVGTTPPPPPPIVTAHASQHEEGGLDELTIDGLAGKAKEKQDPYDHASNHEAAGTDELNVDGLSGALLTPQTPIAHDNDFHTTDFTTLSAVVDAIELHNDDETAHPALLLLSNNGAKTNAEYNSVTVRTDILPLASVPYAPAALAGNVDSAPGSIFDLNVDAEVDFGLGAGLLLIDLYWKSGTTETAINRIEWNATPGLENSPLKIRARVTFTGTTGAGLTANCTLEVTGDYPNVVRNTFRTLLMYTREIPNPDPTSPTGEFILYASTDTATPVMHGIASHSMIVSRGAALVQ